MERAEGPQTPYEVYCHHCHTSFAAGTRTCVHCGNRIGSVRRGPASGPIPDVFDPEAEAEAEELSRLSMGRRLGGLAMWVLLAIGATLLRFCEGS